MWRSVLPTGTWLTRPVHPSDNWRSGLGTDMCLQTKAGTSGSTRLVILIRADCDPASTVGL